MVYFLCMAVVFLMLYLFTDVYYESRYLLPVTIWIVPVIAILFQNENKKNLYCAGRYIDGILSDHSVFIL